MGIKGLFCKEKIVINTDIHHGKHVLRFRGKNGLFQMSY